MKPYPSPKVVAEIGCNHMGDLALAKEMITVASVFCKVQIVKFQKRNARELLSAEQYAAPHPNRMHAYGDSYGAHREFLEFNVEQHKELKAFAAEQGLQYATSVWDMTSAKEITAINPCLIKIPSATNQHYELLAYLCDEFGGEIHVSAGMTTGEEIEKMMAYFEKRNRIGDVVLYSCTSGYPVPFEDICLLEISKLKKQYGNKVKAIGFSGHHLGLSVDIAAYTLGAEWIERHFTLDRTGKGTDHSASLEPDGLRRLARNLNAVHRALTEKSKEVLDIEEVQRRKLKWQG